METMLQTGSEAGKYISYAIILIILLRKRTWALAVMTNYELFLQKMGY